jgi:putative tryptophan/tyrosine transport system substrate-binding protein
MRRREFIRLLGGVAAWPVVAQTQPGDRRPLVGYLVETTKEAHASRIAAFLEGMRDLGYIEGQSVEVAYRFGNFDRARLPALAEELVRLSPHLIFAADPISVLVVKSVAPTAPIVCALLIDPVKGGLARSLARPGGTVTGTLTQVDGLMGKQVELVRELMPHGRSYNRPAQRLSQTHRSRERRSRATVSNSRSTYQSRALAAPASL